MEAINAVALFAIKRGETWILSAEGENIILLGLCSHLEVNCVSFLHLLSCFRELRVLVLFFF